MRHLLSLALHHDQDVVTARTARGSARADAWIRLVRADPGRDRRLGDRQERVPLRDRRQRGLRRRRGGEAAAARSSASAIKVLASRQLDDVLSGRYQSGTGMGLGIVGARRLMDDFSIQTSPAGNHGHAPEVPGAASSGHHARSAPADLGRRSRAPRPDRPDRGDPASEPGPAARAR